jgi:hypothetical protein
LFHSSKIGLLLNPANGNVMTSIDWPHHAPSLKSVPLRYKEDVLSAAYASSLDALAASSRAKLWLHGHVHQAVKYQIGDTRVFCNPRGYPDETDTVFDPNLIVEL